MGGVWNNAISLADTAGATSVLINSNHGEHNLSHTLSFVNVHVDLMHNSEKVALYIQHCS